MRSVPETPFLPPPSCLTVIISSFHPWLRKRCTSSCTSKDSLFSSTSLFLHCRTKRTSGLSLNLLSCASLQITCHGMSCLYFISTPSSHSALLSSTYSFTTHP